jgi:hypothetical protein
MAENAATEGKQQKNVSAFATTNIVPNCVFLGAEASLYCAYLQNVSVSRG